MTKSVRKSYDVSFKLQVLSDYYLSGKSKSFTCRKWGISFPALLEWLKIWPVREEELPLLDEIIAKYEQIIVMLHEIIEMKTIVHIGKRKNVEKL